jgi:hypothetical protein
MTSQQSIERVSRVLRAVTNTQDSHGLALLINLVEHEIPCTADDEDTHAGHVGFPCGIRQLLKPADDRANAISNPVSRGRVVGSDPCMDGIDLLQCAPKVDDLHGRCRTNVASTSSSVANSSRRSSSRAAVRSARSASDRTYGDGSGFPTTSIISAISSCWSRESAVNPSRALAKRGDRSFMGCSNRALMSTTVQARRQFSRIRTRRAIPAVRP